MSPKKKKKTTVRAGNGRYRPLSKAEKTALEDQGCSCRDLNKVLVSGSFNPVRVRNTVFSGEVRLGSFNGEAAFESGISRPAGVYDSRVHNSSIGDDALVCHVGQLAHYDIEPGVIVDRVDVLEVGGVTAFGNAVKIEILCEAGGRELPIYDGLTSQIAYLLVLYRHDTALTSALTAMIERFAESRTSNRGTLRKGTKVLNSGRIVNVCLGPFVTVNGALRLEEATVRGAEADPVLIGEGVVAKRFIAQSGSRIESSAMIDGCFVGQGVRLGKQFSAENSAFFANCEGFHGEAVSLFAGPYTVTHHKSTLLIAGLFSFYNAGSGTNQSNHMYKLGPLHQGVLERGCKTGSFSYLLWPSRVGAYTAVIGKHYANFDTSGLPFSYINEDSGKSVVTPAMNLFTVGTRRDSEKWPGRDRRKDAEK